jgi:hypothetical protein
VVAIRPCKTHADGTRPGHAQPGRLGTAVASAGGRRTPSHRRRRSGMIAPPVCGKPGQVPTTWTTSGVPGTQGSSGCGEAPGSSSSLDCDLEIRRVICSTKAIESLNARFRGAVRARGHFPNQQSVMKTLYLVVRSLDPKRHRKDTMDGAREARPQRVRLHLRRPRARGREPPLERNRLAHLKSDSPRGIRVRLAWGVSGP